MSNVDDIVASIPMNALADQLGVDAATAESAVRQALPALLGGLQANAADPAGAASLAGALGDHSPIWSTAASTSTRSTPTTARRSSATSSAPNTDQVAQTLGGNLGGSRAT